jgi:hypothetical protein
MEQFMNGSVNRQMGKPMITICFKDGTKVRRELVVVNENHRQYNKDTNTYERCVVLATEQAKSDDIKTRFHDLPDENGLPKQKDTGELPNVLEFAVSFNEYKDLCVGVVSLLLKEMDIANQWAFGAEFHKSHLAMS